MNLKIVCALVAVIFVGCGQDRPHLMTLQLNREGNKALIGNSYQGAMEKYLEALHYDPFVNSLHLNLGLSFEGLQQAEKAIQSYKEAEDLALKQKDYKTLFMARFNQAQLLGKAKKVDEALTVYQKALEVIPSSIEVKTNIELLTASQQSQQQGGKGDKDKQDQKQQGDKNQQQNQGDKNKDQKDQKDQKGQQGQGDDKDDKQKDNKDRQDKKYNQSPKYQPRPFKGEDLSEGDVKKILGEIKQQEGKIRAEYNRKETKEQPRDKDW
ncbi:MAG: tetratricopeptide repeat protein [Bdellovibrio sp.]